MGDTMRYRYGDRNTVVAAVDRDTVIEIGDLVYQDVDDAKPASAQADQGSETANQELFADKFLGVALQRSRADETDPIRVATTGVFEFDCRSNTFELGDLMGPRLSDAHGPVLYDQTVVRVTDPKCAIARVVKFQHEPATTVLMDIRSTVMTGGV